MNRFIPEPNSGCWLWEGPISDRGYGYIYKGGERFLAHRVLWEQHHGQKAPPLLRHACDMPGCVNPEHVLPGTKADNARDAMMRKRMRFSCGEQHGRSKLTDEQVYAIRRAEGSDSAIARTFGVSATNVDSIKRRRTWSQLPEEE
jgi:hypothetical protein